MKKKEKIIQTAIRLFVEQGFENTPTSQISKEANVATGTLFHHFKAKEELINSAYLYVKRKIIDETKIHYDTDVKESLKATWNVTLAYGFRNKTFADFIQRYYHSNYISQETADEGKVIMEPFQEIIAEGLKSGVLKDLPYIILAEVYFGIFLSILNYMYASGEMDEELIGKGFELLWDALKK